jgi:endonuclease YncB( thermonuclease family)
MMLHAALLFLILPTRAPLQRNPVFTGKVVRVVSGDTMRVALIAKGYKEDGKEIGLRLWGVDSPKANEPFAAEAKQRMTKVALNRVVVVEDWGRDELGNEIGEVYVELPHKWDKRSYFSEIHGQTGPNQQIVLNDEMVASGLARRWKPSGNREFDFIERRLQQALEAAQKAKRGIWGK